MSVECCSLNAASWLMIDRRWFDHNDAWNRQDDGQSHGGSSSRGDRTSSNSGIPGYLLGDGSSRVGGRVFVDSQGRIVRSEDGGAEGRGGNDDKDLMKVLAKSFKLFPYLVRNSVAFFLAKSRF